LKYTYFKKNQNNVPYEIISVIFNNVLLNAFMYMKALSNKNQEDNNPEITFQDSLYNFGKVDRGKEFTHEFVFTYTRDRNVVINEVEAGCVCTTVPYYSSKAIAPGDTGSVKIKLETAGLFDQAKRIVVRSKAKESRERLIVRAYGE